MKRVFVLAWLALLFSGIFYIFWYNDWKYSLPTPVPKNYHVVRQGTFIDLKGKIATIENRPVFIHFFNPDCPCSRFNIPHFKSLVKQYGNKISFVVVVLNANYTAKQIRDKYDLDIPVLFDSSIAASCGVYSTPQAVLLDAGHRLYYRGNYNKNRYCTNPTSNYAQIAIDSFLSNNPTPVLEASAFNAYGCQLSVCRKPK